MGIVQLVEASQCSALDLKLHRAADQADQPKAEVCARIERPRNL